ncbi:MAG: translation initiation factor IF-6 [Candidatus Altiarchaeales archaeon]|nr:MAG: translation initiation factor IF-6 [Candidatus Altiarchaeales archaeon]
MYQQISVNGEDFVGLLGLATDSYALLSSNFGDVPVLEVPIIKTRIYGTNLVGLFCTGNSHGLLLPYFIDDEKIDKIRKLLSEFDTHVEISRVIDRFTAIGNLVAVNDNAAIVSPKFKDLRVFEDTLDVEIVQRDIAGHEEVGSCCVATNKGFLVHPDAEEESREISEIFKVRGRAGSVNFGFPFVGSGLIANSNGYVTGLRTTGIELGRIDDALGFLEG